jgi:hypothetical protein
MKERLSHFDKLYMTTIVLSTLLSMAWHSLGQPIGVLYMLDYGVAAQWLLFDYMWANAIMSDTIIPLNADLAIMNAGIQLMAFYDKQYAMYHCLFHILSVLKSVYVSTLIVLYDLNDPLLSESSA